MFQDDRGENSGAAYLFKRKGKTWTYKTKLTATDGATNDVFGWSVAISHDTGIVSANRDDDNGNASGSLYVFDLANAQSINSRKPR